GPAGLPRLHLLVEVVVAKEHLGLVGRRIATSVDPPDHPLPASWKDVAFHGNDVAELEAVLLRELAADDARVALFLERRELVRRYLELGVEIEVRGIDGEPRPEVLEIVRISVYAPEPVAPRHVRHPRHLRDVLAVGEREREDQRYPMAGNHPIGGRPRDAGVPG